MKINPILLSFLSLLLFTACEKDLEPDLNIGVSSINIQMTDIAPRTAVCEGEIITSVPTDIASKGICWSRDPNPDIFSDGVAGEGEGDGDFTSTLTELKPLTLYYVRGYANNIGGTIYGDEITFTSADNPPVTAPCSPEANTVFFDGDKKTFTSVIQSRGSADRFSILASGNKADMEIEFSEEEPPYTGKYLTVGHTGFIGELQCSVRGTFGGVLGNRYDAARGDTVYFNNLGDGKYTASFCGLDFGSGSTTFTFISDGNLTVD